MIHCNVSLINSIVSGNFSSSNGGGIQTDEGDVSLTNSTVSANSSGNSGGGIDTGSGDVSLTNSTVNANTGNGVGGGIDAGSGDVSLTNSTVNGNSSGGDGGGIRASFGDVSLSNSTVSGNSSDADGGGIDARSILLFNSTLTDNSALGEGGGIFVVPFGEALTIQNTIVAGNTANEFAPDVRAADSLLLVENSLIGDITGSDITFATGAGNFLNQLPLLGPLADNGGPTQTHALLSGSPAINGGSNVIANANGLTTDQRGEDRAQFGTVDIGAFESGLNERTLIVTTVQDVEDQTDGLISLREAIGLSNEGSGAYTVIFDSGLFTVEATIDITSQLPTITRDLTIVGPSANLLTIDALGVDGVLDGNGFRIFEVNDGDLNNSIDVSISGLTLTGGDTSDSGGAVDNFENLTLDGVAIVGNRASFGGGISNALSGALTITNSTIAGNTAGLDGGGIFNRNELTATNVTISGNSAVGDGSAIATAGDFSEATVNLTHATLYDNIGSGIHFNSVNGSTLATFHNSIIDGSIIGVGVNGTTLAGGYNLFTSADPGIIGTNNLFNETPLLGPLLDNGGSTLTHALQFGSPAINAGSNALAIDGAGNPLTTDQRGQARNQFGTVDIGAFETEFNEVRSLVVTTNLDVEDAGDGLTTLREAIAYANFSNAGANFDGDADGDGLTADTITFDASIFTGGDNNVIRLTQGELSIIDGLTIDGTSVGGVLVTGDASDDDVTVGGTHITNISASFSATAGASDDLLDDNSRVLNFSADTGDLTLTNLTITGGRAQGNFEAGGGVFFSSDGTLTLNESTVSGNLAAGSGGGVFATEVHLSNSTVSENSITGDYSSGGGISAVEVSLINSTVSGNSTAGDDSTGGGIDSRFGGFTVIGNVTLIDSTVSDNSNTGDNSRGGGIAAFGNVTLINSTVSGNSNTGDSLNNYNFPFNNSGTQGGGIFSSSGDVSLTNSTVSGNSSTESGGGIASLFGDVSLTNSTVSGNSSVIEGGGIGVDNGTILLVNSTVVENSTLGIGGGISFQLGNFGNAELTLHNSIVAGNSDDGTAPDVTAVADVTNDLVVEHSLVGDTTGSGITASTGVGNILNQSALLGPLAFNGGSTMTHALLLGSPAIDAGNNALAVDETQNQLTIDQRGEDRIFDGAVDIGAFEFQVDSPFLLGDANQDGGVDFLDIPPFVALLQAGTFLDEADINRDGSVNFEDISPFVSLLRSVDSTPLLGDANLDGEVDFLDIPPFIALIQTGTFLDEADINRDGSVNFEDITPFVSLLRSGGESSSNFTVSTGTPSTSKAIVVESSVSADVSLTATAASESLIQVESAAEVPIVIESSLVEDLDPEAVVLNEMIDATAPQPYASLVQVDDLLDSPVTQVSQIPALDVAVTGITTGGTDVSSEAFPEDRESRLGEVARTPLAQQFFSVSPVDDLGFAHQGRDGFPAANLSIEEAPPIAADFFDTNLESLDEVFETYIQKPF